MSYAQRIKECIDNYDSTVAYFTSLPDKELAKRIDLVHIQLELAGEKKNTSAIELLEIWRAQLIDARILKAENNIPDAPDERKMAIADIETIIAKAEERAETFTDENPAQPQRKPKVIEDDKDQLSLF